MSGILFATEAWHPAGERISECLWYFQTRMNNIDLPLYCDALDTIGIIPFSGPDKYMSDWKERKYISWARIKHRCEAKKSRFEFDHLLCDMFPDK